MTSPLRLHVQDEFGAEPGTADDLRVGGAVAVAVAVLVASFSYGRAVSGTVGLSGR
jgi:hypothetical protein